MGITYMDADEFEKNVHIGDLLLVDYPSITGASFPVDNSNVIKISMFGSSKPKDKSKLITKFVCGVHYAVYLGKLHKAPANPIKSRAYVLVTREEEAIFGWIEIVALIKPEENE
jgi:hypothetical protein